MKVKSSRIHIVMPNWLIDALKQESEKLGISQSDYIRDTLKTDLKKKADADLAGPRAQC
jgi:hypothetical protein